MTTLSSQSTVTPQTICCNTMSNLPILFTKPGISTFINYSQTLPDKAFLACLPYLPHTNLAEPQRQKLHLNEMSAHEGFCRLNLWIHCGDFPGVDPTLSQEPDHICASCPFGKAHHFCHKSHTGYITNNYICPDQGVSSNGLESGMSDLPFTPKGSPSKLQYKYVSTWVDHMSTLFVYVTFHSSNANTELVRSKTEFEQ